VSSIICDCY